MVAQSSAPPPRLGLGTLEPDGNSVPSPLLTKGLSLAGEVGGEGDVDSG